MRRHKHRFIPAVLAATVGMGSTIVLADQPTTQPAAQEDLRAEVQELKQEVAQLQAQDQKNQADEAATIKQVLADADAHSEAVTAGYANRRFFIKSEDGNFLFQPWIHIQVRYSTAIRQDGKGGGNAQDTQSGFELRRARLGFDGNLFTPDFTYFINWATNRENSTLTVTGATTGTPSVPVTGTATSPVGGLPVLEEAWIKYNIHDTPFFVKVGQMHDPLDHENIVGSKYRAPEASLQGDIMGNTDTFTQAATFIFDNKGAVRFEGGPTDGIRAANTNFEDYPNNGINYDGGVAGRVEYKVMGNWHDYDQLTALNDKQPLLVFGSGTDYSYGGDFYSISNTVDAEYGDPNGLFAYLCYFGRYTNHNPGIPSGGSVSTSFTTTSPQVGEDTYEPTALGQVAYLIDNRLEPYARYEYLHLAGTALGSQNNVSEISVGANYYFYGHNLKFTGQVMYLPNGIPVGDDSSDVLISNDKGEIVIITQLQMLL
jgi:hypothetical protein